MANINLKNKVDSTSVQYGSIYQNDGEGDDQEEERRSLIVTAKMSVKMTVKMKWWLLLNLMRF